MQHLQVEDFEAILRDFSCTQVLFTRPSIYTNKQKVQSTNNTRILKHSLIGSYILYLISKTCTP